MDKGVLTIGGITAIVIGVMVAIAVSSPASKPALGQEFPSLGGEHITVGATHAAYNSNPPTSGPHYPQPANWGVYTEAPPDEQLVHNLEHGGIWISYNPDKLDQPTTEKLTQLAQSYPSKVILAPRKADDSVIALASWQHLQNLDSYDESKIREFISRNKNKGPEQVPD